jgi:hypothetical protein
VSGRPTPQQLALQRAQAAAEALQEAIERATRFGDRSVYLTQDQATEALANANAAAVFISSLEPKA